MYTYTLSEMVHMHSNTILYTLDFAGAQVDLTILSAPLRGYLKQTVMTFCEVVVSLSSKVKSMNL